MTLFNQLKKGVFDKKLLFFPVTLLLLCLIGWFSVEMYYPVSRETIQIQASASSPVGQPVKQGDIVEQQLAYEGLLSGIVLTMGTYGEKVQGTLTVTLLQKGKQVAASKVQLTDVQDCMPFEVLFDNAVHSSGTDTVLKLKVDTLHKGKLIFMGTDLHKEGKLVLQSPDEQQKREQMYLRLNTNTVSAQLGLGIIGRSVQTERLRHSFLVLFIWIAAGLLIVGGLILLKHWNMENLFLLAAGTLACFYQMVTVPVSVPDEEAHLTMAYHYSDWLLGESTQQQWKELKMQLQQGNTETELLELDTAMDGASYLQTLDAMDRRDVFVTTVLSRKIGASFVSYLPGIAGVSLGRILNLAPMRIIYLGRVFSMVFYLTLCYWGIRKMPARKAILALVAMLPISLHLGASFSYDSLLLGSAIFFTGFVFQLAQKQEPIDYREMALLVLCVLLLTSGKGIYVLMMALLLVIPAQVWGGKANRGLYLTVLGSLSVLFFIANMSGVLAERNVVMDAGEKLSTSMIWQHPVDFVLLVLNTLYQNADFYFRSLLGGWLGWGQVLVPMVVSIAAAALLVLACIGDTKPLALTVPKRLLLAAIFAAVLAACMVAAISWNEPSTETIEGVQGRYLLQALPLILLSCSGRRLVTIHKNLDRYLILGMFGVNVLSLVVVINLFFTA